MGTKVKEITSNPHGDPSQCVVCNPRKKDRVSHNQVWNYSKKTGVFGLKDGVRV